VLLFLTTILTREKSYLSAGLVSWRLGVLRQIDLAAQAK
jgi:hypothetical protein